MSSAQLYIVASCPRPGRASKPNASTPRSSDDIVIDVHIFTIDNVNS